MMVFNKLWVLMKEKGISTYQLRENCGIDSKTLYFEHNFISGNAATSLKFRIY